MDDAGNQKAFPSNYDSKFMDPKTLAGIERCLNNFYVDGNLATRNNDSIYVESAGGSSISTPFLLTINSTDATKIDIGFGRDPSQPISTYVFHDAILIGNDKLIKTAVETLTLANSVFVYYDITKAGTTITASPQTSSIRPSSINGTLRWVLGYVFFSDGAITSVAQYQVGDITIPARVA